MKAFLRSLLNKTVSRARFDDSGLYGLYLQLTAPQYCAAKTSEKNFYKDLIAPLDAKLIFDIGGNGGAKSRIFASLARSVVCVEANPAAAAKLRQRFLREPAVKIIPKACGAREGSARLHVFEGSDEGYNTLSQKWLDQLSRGAGCHRELRPVGEHEVEVTTLDRLIEEHGMPTYIKIDVEGFEWNVVQGLSHSIPLISVECNLPAFERETLDIIDQRSTIDSTTLFNYVTTEPPRRFESPRWLTDDEAKDVIQSGKIGYMELYCRSREVGGI
jgi:FkbM family methyltransferase